MRSWLKGRKRRPKLTKEAPRKDSIENLYGPSTRITDQQKHQEALSKAEEMQSKQHHAETASLRRTFIRDADAANAFSKLSRYEIGIESRFYRALHELYTAPAGRPPRRRRGLTPLVS